MRFQRLLLFCKRHRRRRWRRLRDHLPVHHCCRRRGHTIRGRRLRSQHALPRGSHRHPRAHRRGSDLPRVHGNRGSAHGLRAREGALRNRRYRALYIPVHVRHIRDVRGFVDDGGVVNIRDLDVIDGGIADVHPVHILPADMVRGHINFPRTQRKPSHIAAEADSNSAANKDHQRGRIDRPHCDRPGHPAPASADRHPASVVKRRVAPWRVIDPGISPRRDPVPMALVIRRPARGNAVGIPDMAVVRIVAPVAIVIQVFIADHVVRHILRRARLIVAVIAVVGPVIKLVGSADFDRPRRSANPSR